MFFVFLGVVLFGTIVLLAWLQKRSDSRTGPVIPMVRIGIAQNSIEAQMWAQRLGVEGVGCRISNYSEIGYLATYRAANSYDMELWVRAEDEEAARELLGLPK
ncbi:MAG: DUF2007 domain-containing protein [Chloroflexota bacterium]